MKNLLLKSHVTVHLQLLARSVTILKMGAMPFYSRSNSQLQDSENCSYRKLPVLGINKVSFICSFYCQHAMGGAEGSNELMSYCVNMNT